MAFAYLFLIHWKGARDKTSEIRITDWLTWERVNTGIGRSPYHLLLKCIWYWEVDYLNLLRNTRRFIHREWKIKNQRMDTGYNISTSGNYSQRVKPTSSACEFTTIEFVGYFYVLTLTCLIGTILNSINIIVFAQKCFSATAYIYMSAISLTDAITLLALLPTGLGRWD